MWKQKKKYKCAKYCSDCIRVRHDAVVFINDMFYVHTYILLTDTTRKELKVDQSNGIQSA